MTDPFTVFLLVCLAAIGIIAIYINSSYHHEVAEALRKKQAEPIPEPAPPVPKPKPEPKPIVHLGPSPPPPFDPRFAVHKLIEVRSTPKPEPSKLTVIGKVLKKNEEYHWPRGEVRTRHMYIPGQSGMGKTVLMSRLAIGDISETKDPVIVIDPKGSKQGLVERILPHIPAHRLNDVVYISLDNPIPIDLLGYRGQREKNLVTSDMITILKRFSEGGSWGPTMQKVMRKMVPTLLEARDTTFLDIGKFLEDRGRRQKILDQVSRERREYWEAQKFTPLETGPLESRMANFGEEPLKTLVSGKRGEGLNIANLIDEGKILLVDTSPQSEDGLMLGALIMSRVQQAIFRRHPDKVHPCCHVYADEFHNFVTSAFNEMLSQARSFNLSLCMANQHPKQIKEVWDDIKGVSSIVIFRMDGEHAAMLKGKIREAPSLEREQRLEIKRKRDRLKEIERELRQSYYFEVLKDQALWREQEELERDVKALEYQHAHQPPTILDKIPGLDIGQAVYIEHTTNTVIVRTPPPLPIPIENPAASIKARNAQPLLISSGDKPPSQPQPSVLELENEGPTTGVHKPPGKDT